MSTVVAIKHKGTTWMGADSQGSSDNHSNLYPLIPKVIHKDGMLMGFAGSFRLIQLLQCGSLPPAPEDADFDSFMRYLTLNLVPKIRSLQSKHGLIGKDQSGADQSGGSVLLASGAHLVSLETDFAALPIHNHSSIGSGYRVAMGSLHSTAQIPGLKNDPEKRLLMALEAAAEHDIYTSAPFVVMQL